MTFNKRSLHVGYGVTAGNHFSLPANAGRDGPKGQRGVDKTARRQALLSVVVNGLRSDLMLSTVLHGPKSEGRSFHSAPVRWGAFGAPPIQPLSASACGSCISPREPGREKQTMPPPKLSARRENPIANSGTRPNLPAVRSRSPKVARYKPR